MTARTTLLRGWRAGLLVAGLLGGLLPAGVPALAADPAVAGPSGATDIVLSAGYAHTCVIRIDGTIACWGNDWSGEASPPPGTFTAVSAGSATCAIRTDGTLACWGANDSGQASPPDGTFTAVSTAGEYTCAIRTEGTLACWGKDWSEGAMPAGTFTAVSTAGEYSCAIRTDGTLACWGDNGYGRATPPAGTFTAVSAGGWHACAIRTDGTLACWGQDWYGQVSPPVGIFTAVGAGGAYTCAIRIDGTLACWGVNNLGQASPPAGMFTALSAGTGHACAIRSDGTLACWGNNDHGQAAPPSPVAAIGALPRWTVSTKVALTWSATPGYATLTGYDVRYRRAKWSGGFGAWTSWLAGTTDTSATFAALPGSTYCFSARVHDAVGEVSSWSPRTCTAIPLDDRSLARRGSWTAGTGAAYYRSTYLRSAAYGARLSRTGVVAKRIALVATTCPTCGKVRVYWGWTRLRTISLYSATRVNRKLIPVATFAAARSGTVRIVVASSGKKVLIDGIAIRRN